MQEEHTLDYVNIGLMLISLVLAIFLPFELFLFSYAVLGPLHYLTEISWLHQRNYFSSVKKDFWLLVFLCFLISLVVVYHDIIVIRKWATGPEVDRFTNWFLGLYSKFNAPILFSALCTAFAMVVTKNFWSRIIAMLLGFLLALPFADFPVMTIWLGMFLPTLIHVYLFTGLFIFYGALKNNSYPGYLSLGVFLLCTVVIFTISYVPEGVVVGKYIRESMTRSGFSGVSREMIKLFKDGQITTFDLFESRRGWMVQRFIAFAYTYHYLNWFSKTEVIRWHKVPKKWLIGSILIWIFSIAIYLIDYRTGLITLFFLSLLHVFLEFPLNIKSVLGIFQESTRLLNWSKTK
jgi:hypothetical protein